MARFNFNFKSNSVNNTTNLAGGAAYKQSPEMELVSILLTSFAQDQFYRNAEQTFDQLGKLVRKVAPDFAAKAAIYARKEFGMRSITHVLAIELAAYASGEVWAKHFYDRIAHRPDDMLEIAAAYRAKGGKNLPNAMKKGFALAFNRFDAYQLAKYRGEGKTFKLVDLVNLVHPVANERNVRALHELVNGNLKNTRTWEAKLTQAGQLAETADEKTKMKAAAWNELLAENKLGYLALLRNLRNIAEQAETQVVKMALVQLTDAKRIGSSLVMPFQILVAMDAIEASDTKYKVRIQAALSDALEITLSNVPRFEGETLVVLDDSGSMAAPARGNGFGNRSCITLGAAFAAALFKSNDADLMRFSDNASYVSINKRDSMMTIAGKLIKNARAGGTNFHDIFQKANKAYDRIIILSDMQGWVGVGTPGGVFDAYKKRTGANPFVYSFDLAGYGSLQFDESKVFCLAGFSDKVFDIMTMLERDRNALVNTIASMTLD
jgi:60 kDa SS-A/Ro ribonucleoprotein